MHNCGEWIFWAFTENGVQETNKSFGVIKAKLPASVSYPYVAWTIQNPCCTRVNLAWLGCEMWSIYLGCFNLIYDQQV